jgi:hypothetical protein
VDVGVPGTWDYGTTGVAWCDQATTRHPYVGRPGAVADIGCIRTDAQGVDPGRRLDPGGTFVWFDVPGHADDQKDLAARTDRPGSLSAPVHSGDRDTFVLAGVQVAIQAPAALRQQIRSTVHLVDQDNDGCDVASPIARDHSWRPDGPAVTELTGVTTVSACDYSGGYLTSSVRLDGAPAAAAITAVAAAPVGGGPNSPPGDCLPDDPALEEVIILQIGSAQGTSQVALHYGGCFHHGLDDGTSLRTLTRPAVAPFVTGPNRISSFSGEELVGILSDPAGTGK